MFLWLWLWDFRALHSQTSPQVKVIAPAGWLPGKKLQGKEGLALSPSACQKPRPQTALFFILKGTIALKHVRNQTLWSEASEPQLVPRACFSHSQSPSVLLVCPLGTHEDDQRPLCIGELIIFFPLETKKDSVLSYDIFQICLLKCIWYLCCQFPENISQYSILSAVLRLAQIVLTSPWLGGADRAEKLRIESSPNPTP